MSGHWFWVLIGSFDLFSKRKIDSPENFLATERSPYQSLFLRNELEKSLRSVFSWGTNWKRDWDRCSIIYWLSTTKYQHHCYTILALAQPVHGFRGGTGLFLLALDQYRVCVPLYIDKSGDIIKCQRSLAGWQISRLWKIEFLIREGFK